MHEEIFYCYFQIFAACGEFGKDWSVSDAHTKWA